MRAAFRHRGCGLVTQLLSTAIFALVRDIDEEVRHRINNDREYT